MPVDYVADRAVELAERRPDGTFHLVAGRNATTVGTSTRAGRGADAPGRPWCSRRASTSGFVHPLQLRSAANRGLRSMEVYFPYFSMRVRFDDRKLGPGPAVEDYFGRLIEFAQAARWGRG